MNEYGERNFEIGRKAAYEMGAEYQANPGTNKREYLDSAAFYFGKDYEFFNDLSGEEKNALIMAFNKGIKTEKSLQ